jgi:hypothetical protein
VNGTQTTGARRAFGAVEGYGVLDSTWSGMSDIAHMEALRCNMRQGRAMGRRPDSRCGGGARIFGPAPRGIRAPSSDP